MTVRHAAGIRLSVCCLSFPRIFPVLVTAEDLFGQTSRFHQAEAQNHGIRCNADQRGVHITGNPHRRNQCCVNRHTDHHQKCLKCKGEQSSEIIDSYMTPFAVAHRCERDRGKRCIEINLYHTPISSQCSAYRRAIPVCGFLPLSFSNVHHSMAIHRRLDSFSLFFYLLLILWVKTELRQNLPHITFGFQLLRFLSANKHFC